MKHPLFVVIVLFSLLLPTSVSAQSVDDVVEKTYCTQGIAYESIDDLKRDLLLGAKREAVNTLFGELIAASTAVENFVLTSDQIRTSSLGLVRIDGDVSYFNGKNFAEVCVSIGAYTTQEDRLKFKPIKLTKRNCVTEPRLTTGEISEYARTQAVLQALLDYDRKLTSYNTEELLKLMQRVVYSESGFVPETETYCTRVEGYVTPIEVLTLLELDPVTGKQVTYSDSVAVSALITSSPSSEVLVFKPVAAVSFQDEGTAGTDDTERLIEQDDIWAPSLVGSVKNDYYATGNSADWFDAVSVNFNVEGVSIEDYDPILRFYAQHGDYRNSFWHHFILQKGKENQELGNTWPPTTVNGADTIDFTDGKWLEVKIPSNFWGERELWFTLRLWNVRLDAIELQMIPKKTVPPLLSTSSMIYQTEIFSPTVVTSFQNEGTAGVDDTELLLSQDEQWAPSLVGSVKNNYYATGNGADWFDALTVKFYLPDRNPESYTAILRFYAQHGDYSDSFWNHYLLQKGKENQAQSDSWPPTEVAGAQSIDFAAGKWIEIDVPIDYWTGDELWLTLRLWNIRVDAIQLKLVPIEAAK